MTHSRPSPRRRQELKQLWRDLYGRATEILNRRDPMGLIGAGAPADEYDAEVSTILPRLLRAASGDQARRVVREEFAHWFGGDSVDYPLDNVADELWRAVGQSGLNGASRT